MIVKVDEDNFSIKLYRDFVKGKLVGLMEVIPIDELLEVWADHKTENSSEKPNNCDPLCSTCKYDEDKRFEVICNTCNSHRNHWQPKTEPQTEEWYTFQDEQEYNARYGKE